MGVVDGQAVDAANTNPAFIDANADDTGTGRYDLANVVPASGPTVSNVQREINSLDSFTGRAAGSAYNNVPTFTNSEGFTATETLLARLEEISAKFKAATGHAHSGAAGDGKLITASALASVPLRGYVTQGTDQAGVTGTSTDVSAVMTLKTPSGGSTTVGVVVVSPENKGIIRQASGANENDVFKDGSGNVVYSRLSYSAGVWTLSYYVDLAGTETPYNFSVSSDVRWYYQELFNPMINPPVYSEFAVIPSDNVTQDVVDATTTTKGKTLLSSTAAANVGSSGTAGTANATVANADHVHQGLHSLKEFVENVAIFGDVTLKGLGSVSITRVGQTFEINAGGGLVPVQEIPVETPDGVQATFTLTQTPYSIDSLLVFVDGVERTKTTAWTLSGTTLTFQAGYIPNTAQVVEFWYLKQQTVVSTIISPKTEYRTITSGEAAAKSLTLAQTPSTSGEVQLDVVSGGPQFYGDDFTVSAAILTWSGLGLDGILTTGDRIRIHYFY